MILICYDGSDDARAAIGQAATLMPGHPALVLTVWGPSEPGLDEDRDAGDGIGQGAWAEAIAADGAQFGHQAGIDCAARTRRHRGSVADAVVDEADRVGARAIVVGHGGGGGGRGAESYGLGPVSSALLRQARCAVLVARAQIAGSVVGDPQVQTGVLA